MKKGLLTLLSAVAIVALIQLNPSCTETQKIDGTITAVLPINAKYISVVHNDKNGVPCTEQVFHSQTVTDGITTVNPHDYIPQYCKTECKSYGDIIPKLF